MLIKSYHRKAVSGFTMIELVCVSLVIVIVTISFIMYMPSSSKFNLSSITEQLKRDILYTQSLSMSVGDTQSGSTGSYSITFPSSTSYQIVNASGNYPILTTNAFPTPDITTVNLPSGVTISSTLSPIYFSSAGYPTNSSGTNLSSTTTITLSSGGYTSILNLCPYSGFVTTGSCT